MFSLYCMSLIVTIISFIPVLQVLLSKQWLPWDMSLLQGHIWNPFCKGKPSTVDTSKPNSVLFLKCYGNLSIHMQIFFFQDGIHELSILNWELMNNIDMRYQMSMNIGDTSKRRFWMLKYLLDTVIFLFLTWGNGLAL